MKKINWTNNTDVRLGFEVECAVVASRHRQFYKKLRELNGQVSVGYDGSIRVRDTLDRVAEIRTVPLPPKDALALLKKVFDIVNEYGYTNQSCGLHVNISSARRSKMRNFNPLPFLSSKLWNEILRKFKRASNGYCKSVVTNRDRHLSKVDRLFNLSSALDNKYRCVNLTNFARGTRKSSRVEVRGFGNTDYTKKFDTIEVYVKRIEKLFKLSCGNIPLTRTFSV